MAKEFIARYGIIAKNNSTISGSLIVTQGITGSFTGSLVGSLTGTASYASQALSSSFATTASYVENAQAVSSSYALTASYVENAQTASYVLNAISSSFSATSSYALNGGVTQLLAGPNILLSPTNGLGQVTISSTGGSSSFNTATGSYGSFYSTVTQTNVAGTARSMSLNVTDITNGVLVSGSTDPYNTYIKTENAGVYNIQFSAQIDKTDSGTDEIWIWLRKNGTNLTDTATSIQLVGNGAHYVAAWNFFANAAADDYFQLMWYSPDANVRLHAEPAFGVVPSIPSLIVTANRIDQFLSNTGSFSGSFTGIATTASYVQNAQSASYVLNAVSSSFSSTASYLNTLNQDLTFNGNLTLNGTASITYLNVAYESSSIIYSSGSNQFGDATNDVQLLIGTVKVSGSFEVTGSVNIPSITGSLLGTSSYASQALSSSFASTASYVTLAQTASYVITAQTASFVTTAQTASYVLQAVSASFATTSLTVTTNANLTGVVTSTGNATAIADDALSIAKTSGLQAALDLKAPLASPTFTTNITTPLIIGGTAVGSTLTYKTTTGVGTTDAHIFQVGDNGTTEAMRILNSGNVGIGTTAPTNILSLGNAAARKFWIENSATDVVGRSLTIAAGSTVAGTSVSDVTGGNTIIQAGLGTGTGASTISFQTGTTLTTGTTLQTMSTKMTILGSGNVGIGVSPTTKLDVRQTLTGAIVLIGDISVGKVAANVMFGEIDFYNSDGSGNGAGVRASIVASSGIASGAGGNLIFNINDGVAASVSEAMRITALGNVGIGTAVGTSKLDVVTTTNSTAVNGRNNSTTGTNYGTLGISAGGGATLNTGVYAQATGATTNYNLRSPTLAAGANNYSIYSDAPAQSYFAGNIGIGVTAPTAVLHLKAGTATANTAPLKFTSGPTMSIAEAGSVEFLTDAYYGTITTGAARKTFAFLESPTFTGTPTLPTGTIATTQASNTNNTTLATTAYADANQIFSATASLSSAQIKALFTTPIQIVANPGSGKYIEVISATSEMTFATASYTTNTTLQIISSGSNVAQVEDSVALLSTVSRNSKFVDITIGTFATTETQILSNVNLVVKAKTGNPGVGDGTAKIKLLYRIVTI